MTDGNPYARMVALVRGQGADTGPAGDGEHTGLGAAPVRMRLGTVVSAVPLKVKVAGLVQPPAALRINERLTKGARWKAKLTSESGSFAELSGPVSGPVTTPMGVGELTEIEEGELSSTAVVIDETTVEQMETDLEKGDTVLLFTEDDQVFFIVMKVVGAG